MPRVVSVGWDVVDLAGNRTHAQGSVTVADPSGSSFPNAQTAGRLPGPLEPVTSLAVISSNGTVLRGLDLQKGVRVLNGVTDWGIDGCKVHAGPTYCVDAKYSGKAGAGFITNSQIVDDAGNTAALINISAGSLLQNLLMQGSKQQVIGSWDAVQLLDSYGFGIVNTSGKAHCENLYIAGSSGSTLIRGNALENPLPQTACVYLDAGAGPFTGITIDANLLAGGGYGMYGGAGLSSNVAVTDMVFSRKFFPKCGNFGPVTSRPSGPGCTWSGNAMDDGTPV